MRRNPLALCTLVFLLQGVLIVSQAVLSRYDASVGFRALAGAGPVLLMVATLTPAVSRFSRGQLASAVVVLASLMVATIDILGFSVFPGLAKDVSPFSDDHLYRSSTLWIFGLIGNSGAGALALLQARILYGRRNVTAVHPIGD